MIYTAERCQMVLFFFKQKTAYELRISDRSSNVCSSYLNYGEQIDPGQLICIVQGTQFPLRYVVMAAIHDLDRWIKTGVEPPEAPRYQFNGRSEEHTSELQSLMRISYAVFCLKKKKPNKTKQQAPTTHQPVHTLTHD